MKYSVIEEAFYPTPRLVSLVKEYSKGRSLDVGCGTGAYFKFFKGEEIVGVDLESKYFKLIDKKKYKDKKVILKKADIRKLPFNDNSFDFVVSSLVLEYMKTEKELKKSINELQRVLKKDGVLVVTTPHKDLFTLFVRKQIISRLLPKERTDPNFIMGVSRSRKDLEKYGFITRGCLGWVTYKALNKEPLAKIIDQILWKIPFFSGTLVGIYKKDKSYKIIPNEK